MLVFSWRTESSLTQQVFLGRQVIFDTYVFDIPVGPTRPQALADVVVCPRRLHEAGRRPIPSHKALSLALLQQL